MNLFHLFFIVGWPRKTKQIGLSHMDDCPNCRNQSWIVFTKERRWLSVFFIPILPIGKLSHYLHCSICGYYREVDDEEVPVFKDLVERTKQFQRQDITLDEYQQVVDLKVAELQNDWEISEQDNRLPDTDTTECGDCGMNIPPMMDVCPSCGDPSEMRKQELAES